MADFIDYLKGEFFDSVYLQQNAFDSVDEATSADRQKHVFTFLKNVLDGRFEFSDKETARKYFQTLRQLARGWNSAEWGSKEFSGIEAEMAELIGKAVREGSSDE
jgi:V/A-type H+-transporting ATPase subunit A